MLPAALLAAILLIVAALAVLVTAATSRTPDNHGLVLECDRPTVTRSTSNGRQ